MCTGESSTPEDRWQRTYANLIPPDVPGMADSGMSDKNRLQHNIFAVSGAPMPPAPPEAPPLAALFSSSAQASPAAPQAGMVEPYVNPASPQAGMVEPYSNPASPHAGMKAPDLASGGDFDAERAYGGSTTVAEPAAAPTTVYKIQPGDSLSRIAKVHFGDATRWREIFELNKDRIDDPNRIFVGDELRLPG